MGWHGGLRVSFRRGMEYLWGGELHVCGRGKRMTARVVLDEGRLYDARIEPDSSRNGSREWCTVHATAAPDPFPTSPRGSVGKSEGYGSQCVRSFRQIPCLGP